MGKKTFLITGGCGFIGSSLIRKLVEDLDNSILILISLLMHQTLTALIWMKRIGICYILMIAMTIQS